NLTKRSLLRNTRRRRCSARNARAPTSKKSSNRSSLRRRVRRDVIDHGARKTCFTEPCNQQVRLDAFKTKGPLNYHDTASADDLPKHGRIRGNGGAGPRGSGEAR